MSTPEPNGFSEAYQSWVASQTETPIPLLQSIENEFQIDMAVQNSIIYRTLRENAAPQDHQYDYYVCKNCYVRFMPSDGMFHAIGPYCSPNCALRANQNAYDCGEITYKTYNCAIDKVAMFFGIEGLRPFPVFSEFRGTIYEYHATAPLPLGFSIAYKDSARTEPEFVRSREFIDSMELN